jgi:hypothetical protein
VPAPAEPAEDAEVLEDAEEPLPVPVEEELAVPVEVAAAVPAR